MLGTETFVTTCMISVVGREAFDRRVLVMAGKSLAACAVVVGVDHFARPLTWPRLALDAATYLTIVLSTGALRAREIAGVVRAAIRHREPALAAGALAQSRAEH